MLVRSLIEDIVDVLNALLSNKCVLETISLATIVEGKLKLDLSKPKIFLVHVQWSALKLRMV